MLTRDSVTVSVDAVVYYRVQNATISIANVENANASTRLLAQTTLRNVLGTKNLAEILSDREGISHFMQVSYQLNCLLSFNPPPLSINPHPWVAYRQVTGACTCPHPLPPPPPPQY